MVRTKTLLKKIVSELKFIYDSDDYEVLLTSDYKMVKIYPKLGTFYKASFDDIYEIVKKYKVMYFIGYSHVRESVTMIIH